MKHRRWKSLIAIALLEKLQLIAPILIWCKVNQYHFRLVRLLELVRTSTIDLLTTWLFYWLFRSFYLISWIRHWIYIHNCDFMYLCSFLLKVTYFLSYNFILQKNIFMNYILKSSTYVWRRISSLQIILHKN